MHYMMAIQYQWVIAAVLDLIIKQVRGEIDPDDTQVTETMSQVKELAATLKKSESSTTS